VDGLWVVFAFMVLFSALQALFSEKSEGFRDYDEAEAQYGLRFRGGYCWHLSPVTDAPLWLRSLPLLERDAVLYLEGEFDPAVEAFLEFRDSESPTLVAPIQWSQPSYHLVATTHLLDELAQLVVAARVRRLAEYAVLYREEVLLLEWPNSFCTPEEVVLQGPDELGERPAESRMLVTDDVREDRVRAFASALGASVRRIKPFRLQRF